MYLSCMYLSCSECAISYQLFSLYMGFPGTVRVSQKVENNTLAPQTYS